MNKNERQREHFNSIAERYNDARQGKNHLLLKELIWDYALGNISELQGAQPKVLEAMCGFCDGKAILERFTRKPIFYSGFDYSDSVVAAVQKNHPEIDCWQADATTFVPDAESCDIVVLLGGLHHVPDAAAMIVKNLSVGLKKDGLFINFEPTSANSLTRLIRERTYRNNGLFDEVTERGFEVDELVRYFLDAGLVQEKIFYPGLLAYILYYNPDAFPWLNIGGPSLVRGAFGLDKLLMSNFIGKYLSFATLSIWRKP
jgi:SAM-dependent methyltransferase